MTSRASAPDISHQKQQQFILCGALDNVIQRRKESGKFPPPGLCSCGFANFAPSLVCLSCKMSIPQQGPPQFFEYSEFQYCLRNILPVPPNKIPGKFSPLNRERGQQSPARD
jgi:hypothetical protein